MALVIVRSDGGTNDYTSLAAAISASETEIEIQGTWSSAETAHYTISSGTTIEATGDAKHPGYVGSSPTHWRAKPTSSGHTFTLNADCTVTGMDISNQSTGSSDECIRLNADNVDLVCDSCLMWFGSKNSEQDIIYNNSKSGCTVSLENCIAWNAGRAVVDMFVWDDDDSMDIDINSCTFYDIGSYDEGRSGVIGGFSYAGTWNIFNSILHISGYAATDQQVIANTSTAVPTITVDRCITNNGDIDNCTPTDSLVSRTFATTDQGDGDYVIFTDPTSSDWDFRLVDLTNAKNNAQDAHADSSGANLSMPSTDIVGNTRATDYCIGAFEIVASGSTLLPNMLNAAQPTRIVQ